MIASLAERDQRAEARIPEVVASLSNHAANPYGVIRKVPFDDRQLEPPEDGFFRLSLEKEPERSLEQFLGRGLRRVARHVGGPHRDLVRRRSAPIVNGDVVDRAISVRDTNGCHGWLELPVVADQNAKNQ
jgi:hypothetical protein